MSKNVAAFLNLVIRYFKSINFKFEFNRIIRQLAIYKLFIFSDLSDLVLITVKIKYYNFNNNFFLISGSKSYICDNIISSYHYYRCVCSKCSDSYFIA